MNVSKYVYNKYAILISAVAGFIAYKTLKYIFNKLSGLKYHIILIEDIHDWKANESEIIKRFKKAKFIGFDCEWVTVGNSRNPVALLQLGTHDGFCVLIRLCKIPVWLIPLHLSDLLMNKDIIKVGVAINEDAKKLFADYSILVYGIFDLRHLAAGLPEFQDKSLSLKNLAQAILNINMNKANSLRCSNWEANDLSLEQIKYASDDAVISARLFQRLMKHNSWFNLIFDNAINENIAMYVDIPFKTSSKLTHQTIKFPTKADKLNYGTARKKPLYESCRLEAPDGELLCTFTHTKANWYVQKGLGTVICDDPLTVRLNFEPSGRPRFDDIFYTKTIENRCVVCGVTENLRRKHVIPAEYRHLFPILMKNSVSHDIVLMCLQCHNRSNLYDQKIRERLAIACDAPIKTVPIKYNSVLKQLKSAATALKLYGSKIPEARKEELRNIIKSYFQVDDITEQLLDEACNIEMTINEDTTPHGVKVFEYFCKNGGLIEFETRWRQHFLDSMQPKFLPEMWSVHHNHARMVFQILTKKKDIDFDISILGLSPELIEKVELYIQDPKKNFFDM